METTFKKRRLSQWEFKVSAGIFFLFFLSPFCPLIGQSSQTTGISNSRSEVPFGFSNQELMGEILPMRKVAISFKVSGRLQWVPLFAGDFASSGFSISSLDPRDFELAVSQSEAILEGGKARLKQLETGARPEEKRTALENLKQALANKDNAQADYQRMQELYKAGAISAQTLDASIAKAQVTEAQYLAATQQKALVDLGPRDEEKEISRAALKQQEATVKLARLQLEYATLKAPFDCVVAQRHLDEGTYVTTTNPIYTVVQINPVIVAVECPEAFVPKLKPGMSVSICVDALPDHRFSGTLERVPMVLDSKTRTAKAEIFVPNPEYLLKPGMFARVFIGCMEK